MAGTILWLLVLLLVAEPLLSFRFGVKGRLAACDVSSLRMAGGFGSSNEGTEAKLKKPEDSSDCPCGSGKSYADCCKSAHEFGMITSSGADLIRARFSAYAIGDTEFIINTSSEQSPDHQYYSALPGNTVKNFKRWGRDINTSMMKDYFFVKVEVDSEALDEGEDDVSTVIFRHLAIQKGSNIMYPIQEKATLVKDDGVAWKYVLGEVGRPDPEKAQEMMESWPLERGMTLNKLDKINEDELDAQEKEDLRDEYDDETMDPRVKAAGQAGARIREGQRRSSNPYGGAFAKGLGPRRGR
jgi:SEC-C motif-containing protein